MFNSPYYSLRERERRMRAAGFTKSEARKILRQPPDKYGAQLISLNYAVVITYIESIPTEGSDSVAGGAGNNEDFSADKK